MENTWGVVEIIDCTVVAWKGRVDDPKTGTAVRTVVPPLISLVSAHEDL